MIVGVLDPVETQTLDLNAEFTRVLADHLLPPMPGNGRADWGFSI